MTCPTCGNETVRKYRPFCSSRCANLDLGKWITGSYRLPDDASEGAMGSTDDTPEQTPTKH